MNKILLTLSLILISLNSFAQDELPNTEVRTLQNELVSFNEVFEPGKVTLVSFWATWCVPCKKEIANIKELLPSWQDEMDIDFVTVSEDDSRSAAKVASYAASQRWEFPTYLDPNGDLKRSLNFQTVPFSMIVDGNGQIVYLHNGYEEGAENEIYEQLKKYASTDTSIQKDAAEEIEEVQEAAPTENVNSGGSRTIKASNIKMNKADINTVEKVDNVIIELNQENIEMVR